MTTQIFTQISDLFHRLLSARRTGYSSRMKAIVKRTPGAVMVFATEKQAKEFGRQGISINNLAELDGKPGMVVVDNALLLHILQQTKEKIEQQERYIERQQGVIEEVCRMLAPFQRVMPRRREEGEFFWKGGDGSGNGWREKRGGQVKIKMEFIPNFTTLRGRHVVIDHQSKEKKIKISIFGSTVPSLPEAPYAPMPRNVTLDYPQFESLIDCIKSIENDETRR
jgi:hypothetical protein